ncbi:hypothetical protein [Sphingobium sp.]|uniref:hypothetical protein n=1 Tax=Sphingobium sp. TaxID=1912891 RepID=UPI00257D7C0C|nr:hypothetical protein [Sphingobium sp.]
MKLAKYFSIAACVIFGTYLVVFKQFQDYQKLPIPRELIGCYISPDYGKIYINNNFLLDRDGRAFEAVISRDNGGRFLMLNPSIKFVRNADGGVSSEVSENPVKSIRIKRYPSKHLKLYTFLNNGEDILFERGECPGI